MLKKLRQQLADARAKANAINQLADTENRDLTPEEKSEFKALVDQCRDLQGQIVAQEALEEMDRTSISAPVGAVLLIVPSPQMGALNPGV